MGQIKKAGKNRKTERKMEKPASQNNPSVGFDTTSENQEKDEHQSLQAGSTTLNTSQDNQSIGFDTTSKNQEKVSTSRKYNAQTTN